MSTSEILAELRKLGASDRQEVRLRLAGLDGDGWDDIDDPLSDDDMALLEARVVDLQKHPETLIPLENARNQLESRYGD